MPPPGAWPAIVRDPVPQEPPPGRRPPDRVAGRPRRQPAEGGDRHPHRLARRGQAEPGHRAGQRYYLGLAFRADGQSAKAAEILDALAQSPVRAGRGRCAVHDRPGAHRGGAVRRGDPAAGEIPGRQARRRGRRLRPGPPGAGPARARPGRRRLEGAGGARPTLPEEQGAGPDPAPPGRGRPEGRATTTARPSCSGS